MEIEQNWTRKTVVSIERDGLDTYVRVFDLEVSDPDMDVRKAVRDACTEFCQTESGKKIYDYNCRSFNWGDFLQENIPVEIMEKHGVRIVQSPTDALEVDWDEHLVDDELLEDEDSQFEEDLHNYPTDAFAIYQLKRYDSLSDLRFMRYEWLEQKGLAHAINQDNYDLVYIGKMTSEGSRIEKLEGLYATFNVNRPADFKGHSLSVSDVVGIKENGVVSYHYVDSVGFKELPDFNKGAELNSMELAKAIAEILSTCGFDNITDSSGHFAIREFRGGEIRTVDVHKSTADGKEHYAIYCSFEDGSGDWDYTDTLSVEELAEKIDSFKWASINA